MKISDLDHLDIVSEETNSDAEQSITGGFYVSTSFFAYAKGSKLALTNASSFTFAISI